MDKDKNNYPDFPTYEYQIVYLKILEFFKSKGHNDNTAFLLTQLEWLLPAFYSHT